MSILSALLVSLLIHRLLQTVGSIPVSTVLDLIFCAIRIPELFGLKLPESEFEKNWAEFGVNHTKSTYLQHDFIHTSFCVWGGRGDLYSTGCVNYDVWVTSSCTTTLYCWNVVRNIEKYHVVLIFRDHKQSLVIRRGCFDGCSIKDQAFG